MGQNKAVISSFQLNTTYLPFYVIPEMIHSSLPFPEVVLLVCSTVSRINSSSIFCMQLNIYLLLAALSDWFS